MYLLKKARTDWPQHGGWGGTEWHHPSKGSPKKGVRFGGRTSTLCVEDPRMYP